MKKTAAVTINLRRLRPIFISAMFSFLIILSIGLAKSLPDITVSEEVLHMILSSNASFDAGEILVSGVFSLHEKSAENTKPEIAPPEIDVSKVNVTTQAPSKVAVPGEVKITNTTKLDISPESFMSPSPTFLGKDFSVLIVHTHTTESYTPSPDFNYVPTDTDRTTDKSFNMVRVGEEIKSVLQANGIRVYHDTTMNDYPSYSGSYNKSAKAIENHIKNDPSIKIVLDVHRDAIEGKAGEKVKHAVEIDGNSAAKIMFVVGSNQSGLPHDNWEDNLRFATQLQSHTESLYPHLCRPINFRSQRFNQQLAPAGIIVEVGTNGNTLDEAILGARYFAMSLSDFVKNNKKKNSPHPIG